MVLPLVRVALPECLSDPNQSFFAERNALEEFRGLLPQYLLALVVVNAVPPVTCAVVIDVPTPFHLADRAQPQWPHVIRPLKANGFFILWVFL
jgi:hypothetical protein